jgi:hypothetical protein
VRLPGEGRHRCRTYDDFAVVLTHDLNDYAGTPPRCPGVPQHKRIVIIGSFIFNLVSAFLAGAQMHDGTPVDPFEMSRPIRGPS